MKSKIYFFRVILPGIYAVAFAAAMIFLVMTAKQMPFCGLYVILVTLPWSNLMLSTRLAPLTPTILGIPLVPTLIIFGSAALNGTILYYIGALIDSLVNRFCKSATELTPNDQGLNP